MTEESSVGRESFTWVSRLPQLGQRMGLSYPAPSLPGLTRQSIVLAKKMDPRVRPGDDGAVFVGAPRNFARLVRPHPL
jgi:hypothetical protein